MSNMLTCKLKPYFDELDKCYFSLSNLGGSGEKYEFNYKNQKYIYKPAVAHFTSHIEEYRGIVQECAYEIQKIVDIDSSVFCKFIFKDELCGSIQKYINDLDNNPFENQFIHEYTTDEINQLLREFVTDYLLFNYDSHGDNFVKSKSGKIYGIDKEQSFKYIATAPNIPSVNYHPNSCYGTKEPIYNTIFKKYINGEVDINFAIAYKYIDKIEKISDEYFLSIFATYTKSLNRYNGVKIEMLLSKILDRKRNLRKYYNIFVDELITLKGSNFSKEYKYLNIRKS